jgi:hypothetical protein
MLIGDGFEFLKKICILRKKCCFNLLGRSSTFYGANYAIYFIKKQALLYFFYKMKTLYFILQKNAIFALVYITLIFHS